ncbi:MAG: hypothetical protein HGA31_04605 [Candidatus Moranbacteria bacterium]|nr:hypothetical protein [Candidatus Moranbacteria bacterium]
MKIKAPFLNRVFSIAVFILASLPSLVRAAASCEDGKTVLMNGVCVPTQAATGLSDREPGSVIATVIYWLMGVLGIVAILMFVVAGVQYLLAGGDEKKTDSAKNIMKFTVMGVAVALVAYMIVYTVQQLVAGDQGTGTAAY